jgi:hypothetical protein
MPSVRVDALSDADLHLALYRCYELHYRKYGSGSAVGMHSALFADTRTALGLDSAYGAYVDELPGPTLATVKLVSIFESQWRELHAQQG